MDVQLHNCKFHHLDSHRIRCEETKHPGANSHEKVSVRCGGLLRVRSLFRVVFYNPYLNK